jgi:hypothetical protein
MQSEKGYQTQYQNLWEKYREEVIDRNENEARLLYQLRSEMITNAQLHHELERARDLIDTLLKMKTVDKRISVP